MKSKVNKIVGIVVVIIILITAIIYWITKETVPGLLSFALAVLMGNLYLKEKSKPTPNKPTMILAFLAMICNMIVAILELVS